VRFRSFGGKTGGVLFENDDVTALDGILDGTEFAGEGSGRTDCEQNASGKRGGAGCRVFFHGHHPCA
jgi:hypothetical protein